VNLAEQLEGFESNTLSAMCAFWTGTRPAGGKAVHIAALSKLLSDPAIVHAAIATWPLEMRLAASMVSKEGTATYPEFLGVCMAAGLADPSTLVRRLLERGLLVPSPVELGGKLRVKELRYLSRRRLEVNPVLFGMPPAALPALRLPAVAPERVLERRPCDPGGLATAVAQIVALASRKRLRLNVDGLPGAPLLATLHKEVGPDALFAFSVALAAGAIVADHVELQSRGDLLQVSDFEELLGALFDAFVRDGQWRDDHPVNNPAATLAELRSRPWGAANVDDMRVVRQVLAGCLRRVQGSGWVSIDEVIAEAVRLDDSLMWLYDESYSREHGGPSTASDRRGRHDLCAAVLVRTFAAFGVVEVGALSADPALPAWRPHDRALNARFPLDRSYGTSPRGLPRWTPDPSPWVIRVTPLGRRLLDPTAASSSPAGEASQGLHVGADFEIVAHRRSLDPGLAFRLDGAAIALPAGPADPIRRWRLERERWLAAMAAGLDAGALLASLAAASDRPVPHNVRDTLAGWGSQFGKLTLYVGFDLEEGSNGRVAKGLVAVGDGWALAAPRPTTSRIVSYPRREARCIARVDDLVLQVDAARADLLLAQELQSIAEELAPGRWRLDRSRVAGFGAAKSIALLERRLTSPMTTTLDLRLRAWGGKLPVNVEVLDVLQMDDALALAALPEVAPHVRGILGHDLVAVRPGARRALLRVLAELGATVGDTLTLSSVVKRA
jgi:hypothetical protein